MSDEAPRYTKRAALLASASKIITQDRNQAYGEPDDHFQHVAKIANALGFRIDTGGGEVRELRGSDHTMYMLAVKLSRLIVGDLQHEDSWMDIAGYAGCGFETASLEEDRRNSYRFAAETPAPVLKPEPMKNLVGNLITAQIRGMAQKATQGRPEELESNGWILVGEPEEDDDDCYTGVKPQDHTFHHTFQGLCGYRIRKRRTDG